MQGLNDILLNDIRNMKVGVERSEEPNWSARTTYWWHALHEIRIFVCDNICFYSCFKYVTLDQTI